MITSLDELAALRPAESRIDAEFPPDRRAGLLNRITDRAEAGAATRRPSPVSASRRPGRWWLMAGAAAATAGLLIAGAVIFRSPADSVRVGSDPDAGSSGTAFPAQPGAVDRLGPDTYQYVVTTTPGPDAAAAETLPSAPEGAANGTDANTRESWIDQDGSAWIRDTPGDGSAVGYLRTKPYGFLNAPTPVQLRTLPTDGQALADYLNGHVHGSSSREAAVFTAISDIFNSYLPTSDLRSALVDAAALNPSTTVERVTDPLDRPAVRITFIDETVGPDCASAVYLDATTLEQVAQSVACGERTFQSTAEPPTVIDSVPTAVTEKATVDQAAPSQVPSTFPDQLGDWPSSNSSAPSVPTTG